MNRRIGLIISCVLLFAGCSSKKELPNTDIEVAKAFVKYVLENNFNEASTLVTNDAANNSYLKQLENSQQSKWSKEEAEQYKNADVIIFEVSNVNDTISIINYANSFKVQEKSKVKVVKINGQWMVDLKYTFSRNL